MEYINFILSIAAIGLCFVLLHVGRTRSQKGNSVFSRQHRMGATAEPAPPLKRTISGPSKKELEELALREQAEKWRIADPVYRSWLNPPATSLSGKKYTYVPPRESRVPANHAARQNVTDINKYRLIG